MNILNRSLKELGSLLVAIIIFTGVLLGSGIALLSTYNSEIETNWHQLSDMSTPKTVLFNKILLDAGYGGLIHQFKNYIIRQDENRLIKIHDKLNNIESTLSDFKKLSLSAEESRAVQQIEATIQKYKAATHQSQQLVAQGKTPEQIYDIVKINDNPMLEGMATLEEAIRKSQFSKEMSKAVLILETRLALGFGGLIHHFKNFVLSQDSSRLQKTEAKGQKALTLLEEYKHFHNTPAEETALQQIKQVVQQYLDASQRAQNLAAQGLGAKAIDQQIKISDRPALEGLDALITALHQETKMKTSELNQNLESSASLMMFFLIISALIVPFATYMTFLIIFRKVIRPTLQLQSVIKQVEQESDFSIRVPTQESRSEVDYIRHLLNGLFQRLETSISEANQVLDAIADGEFDQRITANLNGHLAHMKDGVNRSADSVEFTMQELGKVMDTLDKGDFSARMDEKVSSRFRQRVHRALDTIDQVITETIHVMSRMEQGDFKAKITIEAKGDLENLKHKVNNAMNSLEDAVSDISRIIVAQSKGDLTQTIVKNYPGELGILKNGINTTAQKLMEVISGSSNVSNLVDTRSEEVASSAQELSRRIQEQAAALEETSASMEEMNSTVQANTENAQKASQEAETVQQTAKNGEGVMVETIDAMNAIQESSHRIVDIVTLIDSIAFQTNLLALNAAVEAARAGEHGRGFAVVAGEVRSLAQKSAEASKEIKTLIDETVQRVNQGSKLAEQSGEVLNNITGSISSMTDMIHQIANASLEQTQGIGQVHQAITSIDQNTQQNAGLVENTLVTAKEMNKHASTLRQDMNFFDTRGLNSNVSNDNMTKLEAANQSPLLLAKKA